MLFYNSELSCQLMFNFGADFLLCLNVSSVSKVFIWGILYGHPRISDKIFILYDSFIVYFLQTSHSVIFIKLSAKILMRGGLLGSNMNYVHGGELVSLRRRDFVCRVLCDWNDHEMSGHIRNCFDFFLLSRSQPNTPWNSLNASYL